MSRALTVILQLEDETKDDIQKLKKSGIFNDIVELLSQPIWEPTLSLASLCMVTYFLLLKPISVRGSVTCN